MDWSGATRRVTSALGVWVEEGAVGVVVGISAGVASGPAY